MNRSLKIFTLFQIPVYLHWTFPLMFLWVAYVAFGQSGGGTELFLWLSALVLVTFICVVMHEYGHALTARKYGVATRDIILSPIGGMARLEKLPEQPWHEFLVAVAGPLVNVGLFIILSILAFALGYFDLWAVAFQADPSPGFLLRNGFLDFVIGYLIFINIMLFVFNLIPAFPMDGGRILRSLLSMRLGRVKATLIATRIAQVLAFFGFFAGLYFGRYILAMICIFVLLSSSRENQMVAYEQILLNTTVGELVKMRFTRIYESDTLQTSADLLANGLEFNFLVFRNEEEEEVVGVLPRLLIQEVKKENNLHSSALTSMSKHFELISPEMNLKLLYELMNQKGYSILPVDMGDNDIGKIDIQMLNAFLVKTSKKQSRFS